MTVQYGTSFYFNNRPGNNHLHFVISDPTQPQVLIVNITTPTPGKRCDRSCILDVGDGIGITHPSRIAYEFSELISTDELNDLLAKNKARFVEHVSDATLRKIWDGAVITVHLTLRHVAFLRDQLLLP